MLTNLGFEISVIFIKVLDGGQGLFGLHILFNFIGKKKIIIRAKIIRARII